MYNPILPLFSAVRGSARVAVERCKKTCRKVNETFLDHSNLPSSPRGQRKQVWAPVPHQKNADG